MLPSDHTRLNHCAEHLARLPHRHHEFILSLRDQQQRKPYKRLTPRQQAYLTAIHAELESLGLAEAVAA